MQGGHDVPIPKIIGRYYKSIANCAAVASEVDRLYFYDNSVDGEDAALVLRASRGGAIKTYRSPPTWMAPIVEALEAAV